MPTPMMLPMMRAIAAVGPEPGASPGRPTLGGRRAAESLAWWRMRRSWSDVPREVFGAVTAGRAAAGTSCSGRRPRPLPSSKPSISITSTPASRILAMVYVLRS